MCASIHPRIHPSTHPPARPLVRPPVRPSQGSGWPGWKPPRLHGLQEWNQENPWDYDERYSYEEQRLRQKAYKRVSQSIIREADAFEAAGGVAALETVEDSETRKLQARILQARIRLGLEEPQRSQPEVSAPPNADSPNPRRPALDASPGEAGAGAGLPQTVANQAGKRKRARA